MRMDRMFHQIDKIQKMTDSIKRRHMVYSDLTKIDSDGTGSSMKSLRKAPDPGGKLQKIGFIIFWIPEPFGVTNAIGAPMILAGKYMEKRYNGATIKDIGKATKNNRYTISNFKDSVL